MPSVKDVMVQNSSLPQNIEVSLPAGMPKVSQLMKSVAQNAPDVQLPNLPIGGSGGVAPALPTTFPNIVQGISDALGGALPASGARNEGSANPAVTALSGKRILGGGYRSI